MRKLVTTLLTISLVSAFTIMSCKKSDKDDNGKAAANPCGDNNFCFKVEGKQFSFDAKFLSQAQDRYKVYYSKDLGGTSNEITEITFKSPNGIQTGEYTLLDVPIPLDDMTATFRYSRNLTGDIEKYTCTSGKLNIKEWKNNKIKATFSCTAADKDGESVLLKEGNIYGVGGN